MRYQKLRSSCFDYKLYVYPENIIESVFIYFKGYRAMRDQFGRKLSCWVSEKHLIKEGE